MATRIKIAISIAAADQSRLRWAVKAAARAGADMIHLDIEDGVFIPNITFGPAMARALRPHTDLPFDVHTDMQSYLLITREIFLVVVLPLLIL